MKLLFFVLFLILFIIEAKCQQIESESRLSSTRIIKQTLIDYIRIKKNTENANNTCYISISKKYKCPNNIKPLNTICFQLSDSMFIYKILKKQTQNYFRYFYIDTIEFFKDSLIGVTCVEGIFYKVHEKFENPPGNPTYFEYKYDITEDKLIFKNILNNSN